MAKLIRVRDKVTGHHYSIGEKAVDKERHEVLSRPAVNARGDALNPKFNQAKASAAAKADNKEK